MFSAKTKEDLDHGSACRYHPAYTSSLKDPSVLYTVYDIRMFVLRLAEMLSLSGHADSEARGCGWLYKLYLVLMFLLFQHTGYFSSNYQKRRTKAIMFPKQLKGQAMSLSEKMMNFRAWHWLSGRFSYRSRAMSSR